VVGFAHALRKGGRKQVRLLSVLMSPKRVLDRQWEQRERELNAAFARGRKKRRERAMLDRK
jgi:hypothetical protein